MNPFLVIAGGLVIAGAVPVVVFVAGMRRKSPKVLDAVRRFNRAVTNPRVARSAGSAGSGTALVRHTGRRTNQPYETPIGAMPTPTGFVVALPYGTRSDWVKNVLANGVATIVVGGSTVPVVDPVIVATSEVRDVLPPSERRMLRLFKVDQCMRLSRRDDAPSTSYERPEDSRRDRASVRS